MTAESVELVGLIRDIKLAVRSRNMRNSLCINAHVPISHTISISTIELADGFFRILFLFIGHEGHTLRTILAIIAQLKSRNGTNPLEQFLVLW